MTRDIRIACLADFSYHVPNGVWIPGQPVTTAKIISSLKRQGLKSGVSDLVIALPLGSYHGAYLELKRGAKEVGATNEDQKAWLNRMRDVGYYAGVAASVEEGIAHIQRYVGRMPAPPLPWDRGDSAPYGIV